MREVTGLHHGFDPQGDTALWASDLWDVIKLIWGMFVALQGFFIVAGTITLLVGAIGVMNIMLVVVGERTAEIGLRKALGARGRDIFVQFLLEALAVALLASALGIAGGLLAVRAIAPAFAGAESRSRPRPIRSRSRRSPRRSSRWRSSRASRPRSAPRAFRRPRPCGASEPPARST